MITLDWHAIGAIALMLSVFYFIRNVRVYLILCVVIVVGFAVATFGSFADQHVFEWIVIICGLLLCAFGLLIVRTMLIRSVSLGMLQRLASGQQGSMEEEISHRLSDMRYLGLIKTSDGNVALTSFGRLVSAIVAIVYALVWIKN
jgi:hypothetical protein